MPALSSLYRPLGLPLPGMTILMISLVASATMAAGGTNSLVQYSGPTCHGPPTTTIPIGSTQNDACWQVDMMTYVKSSCDNQTGLLMQEFDKPGCSGPYRVENTYEVNRCLSTGSGAHSTAYLCAGTSPFGIPSVPGKAIDGDGTLNNDNNRYKNPVEVPKGQPYRNWFQGNNCQGKFMYSDTFQGITANDDKCFRYGETNTNAFCKPATDDALGLLTINTFQSGCKDAPYRVMKYNVGYCFYAESNSFMVVCGNSGH